MRKDFEWGNSASLYSLPLRGNLDRVYLTDSSFFFSFSLSRRGQLNVMSGMYGDIRRKNSPRKWLQTAAENTTTTVNQPTQTGTGRIGYGSGVLYFISSRLSFRFIVHSSHTFICIYYTAADIESLSFLNYRRRVNLYIQEDRTCTRLP